MLCKHDDIILHSLKGANNSTLFLVDPCTINKHEVVWFHGSSMTTSERLLALDPARPVHTLIKRPFVIPNEQMRTSNLIIFLLRTYLYLFINIYKILCH